MDRAVDAAIYGFALLAMGLGAWWYALTGRCPQIIRKG